jgi:hypothetical protein
MFTRAGKIGQVANRGTPPHCKYSSKLLVKELSLVRTHASIRRHFSFLYFVAPVDAGFALCSINGNKRDTTRFNQACAFAINCYMNTVPQDAWYLHVGQWCQQASSEWAARSMGSHDCQNIDMVSCGKNGNMWGLSSAHLWMVTRLVVRSLLYYLASRMLGVWLSWPSLWLVIDSFYQCIEAQSFCVSSENKGWQDPMPVVTHVSVGRNVQCTTPISNAV